MEPLIYVVIGGAISLVSSATVTWLQNRHSRRVASRGAARTANRELTRLFIAERDAARFTDEHADTHKATEGIRTEAEMLTNAITDKRVRERLRSMVRLLQQLHLPELWELSGTDTARGRAILCGHALDVLGSHFRAERIPSLPDEIQRLTKVEDEALHIHHGGTPRRPETANGHETPPASPALVQESSSGRKIRRSVNRRTKNEDGEDASAAKTETEDRT